MIRDLRQYLRANKEYAMEYGPFSLLGKDDSLQTGVIQNISGGGLMFLTDEDIATGTQLYVKLQIQGWRMEAGEPVETGNDDNVMSLTAIVEITRCLNRSDGRWEVGAKFVGRLL